MALHFCLISLPLCLLCVYLLLPTYIQDMKNAKSSLKKLTKNLEKEREKLSELEATPERCQKEIVDMEKKLKILEVCMCVCVCHHCYVCGV